jgi:hypothetical protein
MVNPNQLQGYSISLDRKSTGEAWLRDNGYRTYMSTYGAFVKDSLWLKWLPEVGWECRGDQGQPACIRATPEEAITSFLAQPVEEPLSGETLSKLLQDMFGMDS